MISPNGNGCLCLARVSGSKNSEYINQLSEVLMGPLLFTCYGTSTFPLQSRVYSAVLCTLLTFVHKTASYHLFSVRRVTGLYDFGHTNALIVICYGVPDPDHMISNKYDSRRW